ncbi:MAG: UDP-N-acetylmuramate dehydrogenase [Planctomycetota bacterium]
MTGLAERIDIRHDAPIPTWFRVGGSADRLATPRNESELAACLELDPGLRILGEGANLLVADEGVSELVVRLGEGFQRVVIDETRGSVIAGAAADLSRVIHSTARRGLMGLETIIGVPATVGGAVVMNAGGTHGEIGDSVRRVFAFDRQGSPVTLERDEIEFGYRSGGLGDLIVTSVEFQLTPGDPVAAKERLLGIMRHKKQTQPMKPGTCGCSFKNPVLPHELPGLGAEGDRVAAGLLIDRAGGKSMAIGSCRVSDVHANFIESGLGATASDILRLLDAVRSLVLRRFGVTLETEVVVWGRSR